MATWIVLTTPWTFNRGEPNARTFGHGRRLRVSDADADTMIAKGAARLPLETDTDRAPPVDLTE